MKDNYSKKELIRAAEEAWARADGRDKTLIGISTLAGILLLSQKEDNQLQLTERDIRQGNSHCWNVFAWQRHGQRRQFYTIGVEFNRLCQHPELKSFFASLAEVVATATNPEIKGESV